MSDRPAHSESKIEVTPEMIEAGLRELAFFDPAEDPPEYWDECVTGIYRAMVLRAKGDA